MEIGFGQEADITGMKATGKEGMKERAGTEGIGPNMEMAGDGKRAIGKKPGGDDRRLSLRLEPGSVE